MVRVDPRLQDFWAGMPLGGGKFQHRPDSITSDLFLLEGPRREEYNTAVLRLVLSPSEMSLLITGSFSDSTDFCKDPPFSLKFLLYVTCFGFLLHSAFGIPEGCSLLFWAKQLLCKQTHFLLPVTLELSLPLK